MEKAIIGKKVGMTQIFDADGKVVPVTVIEAGPCSVVQKKTAEKDGYEAVQLGFMPTTDKHLTRGQKGHLAKAGVGNLKVLKEFKLDNYESLNVGDELKADTFAIGDRILIMNEGELVEEGSTEEVITRPKTIYTRRLLDAVC